MTNIITTFLSAFIVVVIFYFLYDRSNWFRKRVDEIRQTEKEKRWKIEKEIEEEYKSNMKNRISGRTVVLLLLLVLRVIGSAFVALGYPEDFLGYTPFALAYLAAFIGVIKKQTWGPITAIIISIVDIFIVLTSLEWFGGARLAGNITANFAIAALAFFEYRKIKTTD